MLKQWNALFPKPLRSGTYFFVNLFISVMKFKSCYRYSGKSHFIVYLILFRLSFYNTSVDWSYGSYYELLKIININSNRQHPSRKNITHLYFYVSLFLGIINLILVIAYNHILNGKSVNWFWCENVIILWRLS